MKCRSLIVFTGDPPEDSGSVLFGFLLVGVVFFPSLPFMGVMLFPNASGGGGTLLVPLSLFSILLSLPLFLFSFSFFFILSSSLSSFLPRLILPFSFSYAQTLSILFFLLLLFSTSFLSFSFLSFFFFFLRELLVLCASKI